MGLFFVHGRFTPESSGIQSDRIILEYVVSGFIQECYRCFPLLFLCSGISVALLTRLSLFFVRLIFINISNLRLL